MTTGEQSRRGYVYVLTNKSIPDLVKIGRSINGGRSRASQLYQTGVPEPFDVYFEMLFDDAINAERDVHQHLSEHRHSESREFFRVEPDVAEKAIVDVWAAIKSMYLVDPDEALCVWEADSLAKKFGVNLVSVALRLNRVTEDVLFSDISGKGAKYFFDNLPEAKQ